MQQTFAQCGNVYSLVFSEELKLCSYMQTHVQEELMRCSYMQTLVQEELKLCSYMQTCVYMPDSYLGGTEAV